MTTYAGDVTPQQAWDMLASEAQAQLVDVRSGAEWSFVGGPDLSALGKKALQAAWQNWPGMALNERFIHEVVAAKIPADAPVLLLCRSGMRSQAAATALTAAGFTRCYNILGGFEGALDPAGHRGGVDGWKVAGLAWKQS